MSVCLGVSQQQLVDRRLVPTKGLTLMMRIVWSSDDVGPDGIDDGVGCDDCNSGDGWERQRWWISNSELWFSIAKYHWKAYYVLFLCIIFKVSFFFLSLYVYKLFVYTWFIHIIS
ncbi:hypothetical protein Hanom_Chr10g00934681 [Helianthus anomalus]